MHGPVFLGADPEGDRQVAIKTFPLDVTPERAASLAEALRQLVATPLGHPSIVPLLDAGAEGSTVYLVQEYVLAESVDAAVRQYGPAPVPDALRLVGQLAGALDFAAVAGVHHGALHPRDVLVAPNEVRLTGLGVAQTFEQAGLHVTPRRPYSAPERHEQLPWSTPADVFSLAAVGFEMLTGRRPGSAEALAADTRSIPSPNPAGLAEVFARALSGRPADRYQTALAFAAALRHALTGEPLDLPDAGPLHAAPEEQAPAATPPVDEPVPPELRVFSAETALRKPDAERDEPARLAERASDPEIVPELEVLPPPEPEVLPPPEPEVLPPPEPEVLPPPEPAYEPDASPAGVAADEHDLPSPEPDWEVDAETPAPPAAADEFRVGDAAPEDERPAGPLELGDEPESRPAVAALLPLEIEMEPEQPAPPMRPLPPPPTRPLAPPQAPPMLPPDGGRAASRRARFPLSSLLAMLLLGVLAGFIGGYFVGLSAPDAPAAAGAGPVPPAEVARPEPTGQGAASAAGPAGSEAATPRTGRPSVAPPAAPAGAAPAGPRAATPDPVGARRPSPRAAERDAEPDGPFEAPLSVVSRPAGALVRLDGRGVGKTPLRLAAIRAGAHLIRLELNGYLPWTSGIQVVSGVENRVTASLERRPGGSE